MILLSGGVLWAAYTLGWWAYMGLSNRVPEGKPGEFWWPSIRDLIVPQAAQAGEIPNTAKGQKGGPGGLSDLTPLGVLNPSTHRDIPLNQQLNPFSSGFWKALNPFS